QALAAAFASLRACLANFLAALCALRASLNLALANRAMLRAVSACFSASAALAASDAAPCLLRRLGVFGSWFFIIVATRGVGSVGRPGFGGGLRLLQNCGRHLCDASSVLLHLHRLLTGSMGS